MPQFRDFESDEDRAELVESVLSTYKEGVNLAIWVDESVSLQRS